MIARSVCLLLLASSAFCAISPTLNDYTHSLELLDSDRYTVFWKYDATTITFEVHAKTLGWVGFGLTPNGGMAGSDMTITWIKDGNTFFSDRHALGKYEPVKDASQDWNLLSAEESGQYTIIKLSRKHVTGDPDDLCITKGTSKLIFSYNPNDPLSESGALEKHTEKGSRSVDLLSAPTGARTLPADAISIDLFMRNGVIGSVSDTTYWCEGMKPPQLSGKHQVIMIEPIIEAGHESFVHHMILTACEHTMTDPEVQQGSEEGGLCYDEEDEDEDENEEDEEDEGQVKSISDKCEINYAVWAVGDGKFWFPENIGLPFDTVRLLRLQAHYDNPSFTPDIIDHSGFRLWLTPTLREHDAGVLMAGSESSPFLVVPPGSDGYLVRAMCHGECLADVMNASAIDHINIFATMLHSHLAGIGIRTMHIRDGVELPPIATDNSYDFDFQTTRTLPQEVMMKKGDHLMIECVYNTKTRTKPTFGGLSTQNEMCLGFFYYYPKIPIVDCKSNPSFAQLSDIIRYDEEIQTACYVDPNDPTKTCNPYVTQPEEHQGDNLLKAMEWLEWTNLRRNRMQKFSTEGIHEFSCESPTTKGKADRFPKFVPYKDESIYSSCPSTFEKFDNKEPVPVNYTMIKETIVTIKPLAQDYTHSVALLDGDRFQVFWKYDATTITFEVHAKTLGWVGFGLTPNGGMVGSDMTITWIKDGKTYFSDRHALGEYEPVKDASQDWNLLSAEESGQYTIIKLSRKHVTNDSNDLCITDGTMRLIYAYNQNDPTGESGPLQKHTVKGSKSIQLLSRPRETEPTLPNDAFPVDVLMKEGLVFGDVDTTYWCQSSLPPNLDSRHHVVMIEPMIEEGHEWLVHHMVLYACEGDQMGDMTVEEAAGYHSQCNMYHIDHPMQRCSTLIYAWAVGSEKFWYPDGIGFPMGTNGLPTLFKLEMHYDNPNLKKGIVDHSGLRLWVTPTPRASDAGCMTIGMGANEYFIPPNIDNFRLHGICPAECLSAGLEKANTPEIKLFGYFLHSHLAGVALRVRHFRNGEELPPIAVDDTYDFNFQEVRRFPQEVVVKAGDHFVVECAYKTKDRQKITWAGLGTGDEMCNAFLLYHPKIPLTNCMSWPAQAQAQKFLEPDYQTECGEYFGYEYCQVKGPSQFAGKEFKEVINQITWNSDKVAKLQKIALTEQVQYWCDAPGKQSVSDLLYYKKGSIPKATKTYVDDSIYGTCPTFFGEITFDTDPASKGAITTVSLTLAIFSTIGVLLQ